MSDAGDGVVPVMRRKSQRVTGEDDNDDASEEKCSKVTKGILGVDVHTKVCNNSEKETAQVKSEGTKNDINVSKNVDWMSLPKEVWSTIFQWIPAKDKVSSRLVSKDWKENIDSLSSFAIKLHGRLTREELNRFYKMRIHCIELMSLKIPLDLEFKYPKYVRELIVTTLVSPSVFSDLCQIFTEVQALRVVSTLKSDTTFDPNNRDASNRIVTSLRKLKEIDVTIHGFGSRGLWASETFNVIIGGSLVFPLLSIVSINMLMHHEEMESLFRFLIRHRNSLRCVTARVGCMTSSALVSQSWPGLESFVKFSESEWFDELKDLKLQSLHVFRAQTCGRCDVEDVWSAILQNQSSLVKLTADSREVEVTEFFDVLRKNPQLRSCHVYRLRCLLESENLLIDSQYQCLEELTLDFVSNIVLLCGVPPFGIREICFQFFDFKNLPSSLRKLSIRGYTLPQSQFIAALKDLKYVEELNIGDSLFIDKTTRIALFKQVCHIFSFPESSVRRFIFDAFEDPSVEPETQESILWRRIEEHAAELGILNECFNKPNVDQPVCDFQFTKEKMRQFLDFLDNAIGDDDSDVTGCEREGSVFC